jgi:pellino protein
LCRILAGGFDESNQIFLGEQAISWKTPKKDGLITNGVRVLYAVDSESSPKQEIHGGETKHDNQWREVTCRGEVRTLRSRYKTPGKQIFENNVLTDGTLITFGGITLMWRAGHALRANELSHEQWNRGVFQHELNRKKAQCPVSWQPPSDVQ